MDLRSWAAAEAVTRLPMSDGTSADQGLSWLLTLREHLVGRGLHGTVRRWPGRPWALTVWRVWPPRARIIYCGQLDDYCFFVTGRGRLLGTADAEHMCEVIEEVCRQLCRPVVFR